MFNGFTYRLHLLSFTAILKKTGDRKDMSFRLSPHANLKAF